MSKEIIQESQERRLKEELSLDFGDEIHGYKIVYVDLPKPGGYCGIPSFEFVAKEKLKEQFREIISKHLIKKGLEVLESLQRDYPFIVPRIRIQAGELPPSSLCWTTKQTYLELLASGSPDPLAYINIDYAYIEVGGVIESCILRLGIERLP